MSNYTYEDEVKDIINDDENWEDEVYTYDPDSDIEYLYG